MILFGPLLIVGAIYAVCWLLFTLAIYALPFCAAVTVGGWAAHTGAGAIGGIIIGTLTGWLTVGLGQTAIARVPWNWARLLIIIAFVAPAVVAGYCAIHGIARLAIPSPAWQDIFSVAGAAAVGVTSFVRFSKGVVPGVNGQAVALR